MLRRTSGLLITLFASGSAFAGPIIPGVTELNLFGTDGVHDWSMNPENVPFDEFGNFKFDTLPTQALPTFTVSDIVIEGNIDPVLSVSFNVTNNTAATQTYTFSFGLPIAPPVLPSSLTGGSTGITLTDNNADGATASDSPASNVFYTALIDGVPYDTLDVLGADLVAGVSGSAVRNDSFGTPIPSQAGPPALISIGMEYTLTITPGDSAAVTGVFVVEPVPEPTSLTLLAIGGGLLARRRR